MMYVNIPQCSSRKTFEKRGNLSNEWTHKKGNASNNFDFLFFSSTLIGSLAPLPLIHMGVPAIPPQ